MKNVIGILIFMGALGCLIYIGFDYKNRKNITPLVSAIEQGQGVKPNQQNPPPKNLTLSNELSGFDIALIAASESDRRAVVTINGGSTQVLEVGDTAEGTSLSLVQVSNKKLVFKDSQNQVTYLVSKVDGKDKSTILRLSSDVVLEKQPDIHISSPVSNL